jgi:hypothetical protein
MRAMRVAVAPPPPFGARRAVRAKAKKDYSAFLHLREERWQTSFQQGISPLYWTDIYLEWDHGGWLPEAGARRMYKQQHSLFGPRVSPPSFPLEDGAKPPALPSILAASLSVFNSTLSDDTLLLGPFFYSPFQQANRADGDLGACYSYNRKGIGKMGLFSKKYILFPVYEVDPSAFPSPFPHFLPLICVHFRPHFFLTLVCHPALMLREDAGSQVRRQGVTHGHRR